MRFFFLPLLAILGTSDLHADTVAKAVSDTTVFGGIHQLDRKPELVDV